MSPYPSRAAPDPDSRDSGTSTVPLSSPTAPIRADARAALVLGTFLSFVGILAWVPVPPGVWHDDGVYLLLGKALASGEGLTYLGVSGTPPAPKFPPLYPLTLAGIWRLAPSFPGNAPLFQLLNLFLVAAAGAAFFLYLRRGLGLSRPLSAVATLVPWLSGALWAVAVVPLSEPLFLFLFVLALWAAAALETGEKGGGAMALFLLAFVLVFHARTPGAAAGVGAVGALLLRGRVRRGLAVLTGCAVAALPWVLWSRAAARRIPTPQLDVLGPYGRWLLEEATRSPVRYVRALGEQGMGMMTRLGALLLPVPGGWLRWILLLLLLPLGVAGLAYLWRHSRSTVLALAAYLAIVWIWPFQDARLLLPVLPWAVLIVILGGSSLVNAPRSPATRRVGAVGGALVLVWMCAFGATGLWRLSRGDHAETYRIRSEGLERAAVAVARSTPTDAVVGAPEMWAALHLYTGRTVLPSARFLPLYQDGPSWGTPHDQFRLWSSGGMDHLLLELGGGVHGEALNLLDARCPGGSVIIVHQEPGLILVRLDWDRECRRRLGL